MSALPCRGGTGMTGSGCVVITGASRGLGFASAVDLYRRGWHVIAAVRTPAPALAALREATGATPDDPRLSAMRLDVEDESSIVEAACEIEVLANGPFSVVHCAGIVSAGCVEEMPFEQVEHIFATNVFGAMRLTKALLPAMRAHGSGRIVYLSSEGAIHGMPAISAYSASKGALERWAEALSLEVSQFGIGVSVLIVGTFKTDMLDRGHIVSFCDEAGPYAQIHRGQARLEDQVDRLAQPPERFPPVLARVLEHTTPFSRVAAGRDAQMMRVARWCMTDGMFQRIIRKTLSIPRPGALRHDARRLLPIRTSATVGEG